MYRHCLALRGGSGAGTRNAGSASVGGLRPVTRSASLPPAAPHAPCHAPACTLLSTLVPSLRSIPEQVRGVHSTPHACAVGASRSASAPAPPAAAAAQASDATHGGAQPSAISSTLPQPVWLSEDAASVPPPPPGASGSGWTLDALERQMYTLTMAAADGRAPITSLVEVVQLWALYQRGPYPPLSARAFSSIVLAYTRLGAHCLATRLYSAFPQVRWKSAAHEAIKRSALQMADVDAYVLALQRSEADGRTVSRADLEGLAVICIRAKEFSRAMAVLNQLESMPGELSPRIYKEIVLNALGMGDTDRAARAVLSVAFSLYHTFPALRIAVDAQLSNGLPLAGAGSGLAPLPSAASSNGAAVGGGFEPVTSQDKRWPEWVRRCLALPERVITLCLRHGDVGSLFLAVRAGHMVGTVFDAVLAESILKEAATAGHAALAELALVDLLRAGVRLAPRHYSLMLRAYAEADDIEGVFRWLHIARSEGKSLKVFEDAAAMGAVTNAIVCLFNRHHLAGRRAANAAAAAASAADTASSYGSAGGAAIQAGAAEIDLLSSGGGGGSGSRGASSTPSPAGGGTGAHRFAATRDALDDDYLDVAPLPVHDDALSGMSHEDATHSSRLSASMTASAAAAAAAAAHTTSTSAGAHLIDLELPPVAHELHPDASDSSAAAAVGASGAPASQLQARTLLGFGMAGDEASAGNVFAASSGSVESLLPQNRRNRWAFYNRAVVHGLDSVSLLLSMAANACEEAAMLGPRWREAYMAHAASATRGVLAGAGSAYSPACAASGVPAPASDDSEADPLGLRNASAKRSSASARLPLPQDANPALMSASSASPLSMGTMSDVSFSEWIVQQAGSARREFRGTCMEEVLESSLIATSGSEAVFVTVEGMPPSARVASKPGSNSKSQQFAAAAAARWDAVVGDSSSASSSDDEDDSWLSTAAVQPRDDDGAQTLASVNAQGEASGHEGRIVHVPGRISPDICNLILGTLPRARAGPFVFPLFKLLTSRYDLHPNADTYAAILTLHVYPPFLSTRRALRLVRAMRENGVAPNSKVFAQLVTLFARSGNLDRTMSTLSAALSAGCVLPPETYESVARCILLRLNERGNAAADNLSTARSRMASLRDIMSKNGVPAFRREFMEYMERQRGGSSRCFAHTKMCALLTPGAAALAVGAAVAVGVAVSPSVGLRNDIRIVSSAAAFRVAAWRWRDATVADMWERTLARLPSKPAIIFEGRVYTFHGMDVAANRVAAWAMRSGFAPGSVVALVATNSPAFVITWLGLTKAGVRIAFVNNSLRKGPLRHAIRVVKPVAIITEQALAGFVHDALTEEAPSATMSSGAGFPDVTSVRDTLGGSGGGAAASTCAVALPVVSWRDVHVPFTLMDAEMPLSMRFVRSDAFDDQLLSCVCVAPPASYRRDAGLALSSTWGYVYTSGTTGLPKPAIITHLRVLMAGYMTTSVAGIHEHDVLYTCMPLYHSSAGMIAVGCTVIRGTTLVLSAKFSSHRLWHEIATHDVTVLQYIGELCRYMVQSPSHPQEARHKVRLALGNGMRPDVWPVFQARFAIPLVVEFYASTEGNASLANYCSDDSYRGAVGRMGWLARKSGLVRIVKFDEESETIVRGKDGFAIECADGEAGELISKLNPSDKTGLLTFKGYEGAPAANESKIARNVFVKGDMYFRSGDLLRRSAAGGFYFVDRVGDTFRWHGENVAASEVADVLHGWPSLQDIIVYGVQIPGMEGRAGMAAICLAPAGGAALEDDAAEDAVTTDATAGAKELHEQASRFDWPGFSKFVTASLPSYAIPRFVRLMAASPLTGTFKHTKTELKKQGADVTLVSDPVFLYNVQTHMYEPMTLHAWATILQGKARL